MKNIFTSVSVLLFSFCSFNSFAQSEYLTQENNANHPCITDEQYSIIEKRCNENIKLFNLEINEKTRATVKLNWTLKPASGFTDCNYYLVSAYVDHDATAGVKDFNCGSNTYNGHRGTDIAIYPFPFYKMDNNHVEVVAAAAGTILDKSDGNFDRNCGSNSLTANYVFIQHSDGSTALYFHMKKNSVTTKGVGQTVAAGEYLGVVGSSGNSSGPHLHFEVRTGLDVSTLNDPYSGSCNSLNGSSLWTSQKFYTEPALLNVTVNTTDVVIPACPGTETLNESNSFSIPFQGANLPAGYAKFYIFLRNEINGMNVDMSILNPDATVFTNWTYSSTANNKARTQTYSKKLPTTPGTYLFKATYNGTTCSKSFDITAATSVTPQLSFSKTRIYPNPSDGNITVELGEESAETENEVIEFYNVLGEKVFQSAITHPKSAINLNVAGGVYFYEVKNNKQFISSGKLIISKAMPSL